MAGPVFACPSCHAALKSRIAPSAGRKIKCPRCGVVFAPVPLPADRPAPSLNVTTPPNLDDLLIEESSDLTTPGPEEPEIAPPDSMTDPEQTRARSGDPGQDTPGGTPSDSAN